MIQIIDLDSLVHHLSIAAEHYERNVETLRSVPGPESKTAEFLIDQFRKQAAECREAASFIINAEKLEVSDSGHLVGTLTEY